MFSIRKFQSIWLSFVENIFTGQIHQISTPGAFDKAIIYKPIFGVDRSSMRHFVFLVLKLEYGSECCGIYLSTTHEWKLLSASVSEILELSDTKFKLHEFCGKAFHFSKIYINTFSL
jgi:hypothetical protein